MTAPQPEHRVTWFRPAGERPVNGGGNTVFVRPADDTAAPVGDVDTDTSEEAES